MQRTPTLPRIGVWFYIALIRLWNVEAQYGTPTEHRFILIPRVEALLHLHLLGCGRTLESKTDEKLAKSNSNICLIGKRQELKIYYTTINKINW